MDSLVVTKRVLIRIASIFVPVNAAVFVCRLMCNCFRLLHCVAKT